MSVCCCYFVMDSVRKLLDTPSYSEFNLPTAGLVTVLYLREVLMESDTYVAEIN